MTRSIIIGLCLLSYSILTVAQPDPFPQVADSYLVEIDGAVVWEKQSNKRLPQASLTKLMTSLLVLEKGQIEDVVIISKAASKETGSRLNLMHGDRFLVKDLIAATLIASANDACHALADHLAGNDTEFVKLMNIRASELGLGFQGL